MQKVINEHNSTITKSELVFQTVYSFKKLLGRPDLRIKGSYEIAPVIENEDHIIAVICINDISIPVVDIWQRLGLKKTKISDISCVLICHIEDRYKVGILVDDDHDILKARRILANDFANTKRTDPERLLFKAGDYHDLAKALLNLEHLEIDTNRDVLKGVV